MVAPARSDEPGKVASTESKGNAVVVCIAGMHRSGTSMITQILHLSGLYLGRPDDIMSPQDDNTDGYWENNRFVELNDEILSELGAAWDYPPSLSTNWDDERLAELRAEATAILQEFSDHQLWGWKDPRNSLTLPFWLSLLPHLRVVVCLRNPLEVALSLRQRGYSSYVFALNLWQSYNAGLLRSTTPEQRIITHYGAYFDDPQAELQRVLSFLDILALEEVVNRACEAIKPRLRHNEFTAQHLLDVGVSPDLFDLYLEMCDEAGWSNRNTNRVPAGSTHISHADPRARLIDSQQGERLHKPPRRLVDRYVLDEIAARRQVEMLRSAMDARDHTIRELQTRLEESMALVKRNAEGIGQRDEMIHELQGALKSQADTLSAVSQVQAVVSGHSQLLASLLERIESLTHQDEGLKKTILDVEKRVLGRHDEIQSSLYRLETDHILAHATSQGDEKHGEYQLLIQRIREVVRAALPDDAIVTVVSKGDDELLRLYGRTAWHFPQNSDGDYSGYYPTGSTSAIAHLEWLRASGADYLLFPHTALWWLDYYPAFRRHLESRYKVVVRQEETCVIFALRASTSIDTEGESTELEEIIVEYRSRHGRDPAILDWNTGLHLVEHVPEYTIFSPSTVEPTLPYLDHSVDVIVISSRDSDSVAEARRVAANAVVTVVSNGASPSMNQLFSVEWLSDREALASPTTSIIIPSHNGIAYTEACLLSLRETLPKSFQGEIIVVDDASTDDTQERLNILRGQDNRLKVVKNTENVGFIASCNRGASFAVGEILLFLNNDTVLLPGWLPPLLRIFQDYPDAGAVGGKLLFPDGRLQEAGGIIFRDGSADHFGREALEVDDPLFNYVREVDYCSGALLATRHWLFKEVGGFDTYYQPAYYEDVDYCFQVREKGYGVYYQPESVIVHFEGGTAGKDVSTGAKRFQLLNRAKFVERWSHRLSRHARAPGRRGFATWHALAAQDDEKEELPSDR